MTPTAPTFVWLVLGLGGLISAPDSADLWFGAELSCDGAELVATVALDTDYDLESRPDTQGEDVLRAAGYVEGGGAYRLEAPASLSVTVPAADIGTPDYGVAGDGLITIVDHAYGGDVTLEFPVIECPAPVTTTPVTVPTGSVDDASTVVARELPESGLGASAPWVGLAGSLVLVTGVALAVRSRSWSR